MRKITILMTVLLLVFLFNKHVCPQATLFADDFSSGNYDSWEFYGYTSGAYQLE